MPGDVSQRRALLPVVLVVVITGFVVLVATLAASTGPTEVFAGAGPDPDRVTTNAPSETPASAPTDDPDSDVDNLFEDRESGSLTWVGTVVRAILLVLIVAALVLTVAYYARRGRRLRAASAVEEAAGDDFGTVDAFAAVSSALVEDAEQQDAALREGSPRNGIVEAWLRFELQAAAAGEPREEWETSTEFTLRLLESLRADLDATSRLAELYRVARFSAHPVAEADREAAAEALRRIRDGLRDAGRQVR